MQRKVEYLFFIRERKIVSRSVDRDFAEPIFILSSRKQNSFSDSHNIAMSVEGNYVLVTVNNHNVAAAKFTRNLFNKNTCLEYS